MFDINKCKIDDKGHIWAQTKDSRKVRILCADSPGKFPIVAIFEASPDCWQTGAFAADGKYSGSFGPSVLDLANVPERRVVWVNFFERFISAKMCNTKSEAEHDATVYGSKRIACVQVEFTEGDGL